MSEPKEIYKKFKDKDAKDINILRIDGVVRYCTEYNDNKVVKRTNGSISQNAWGGYTIYEPSVQTVNVKKTSIYLYSKSSGTAPVITTNRLASPPDDGHEVSILVSQSDKDEYGKVTTFNLALINHTTNSYCYLDNLNDVRGFYHLRENNGLARVILIGILWGAFCIILDLTRVFSTIHGKDLFVSYLYYAAPVIYLASNVSAIMSRIKYNRVLKRFLNEEINKISNEFKMSIIN